MAVKIRASSLIEIRRWTRSWLRRSLGTWASNIKTPTLIWYSSSQRIQQKWKILMSTLPLLSSVLGSMHRRMFQISRLQLKASPKRWTSLRMRSTKITMEMMDSRTLSNSRAIIIINEERASSKTVLPALEWTLLKRVPETLWCFTTALKPRLLEQPIMVPSKSLKEVNSKPCSQKLIRQRIHQPWSHPSLILTLVQARMFWLDLSSVNRKRRSWKTDRTILGKAWERILTFCRAMLTLMFCKHGPQLKSQGVPQLQKLQIRKPTRLNQTVEAVE